MHNIRFERKIDESSHDEWYFYYLYEAWILQEYAMYKRPAKKHKLLRRIRYYNRIDERDNTIKKEDIEITHEIEMMLLSEIVKTFRVMK